MSEVKEKKEPAIDIEGQIDRAELFFHKYKKQMGIAAAAIIGVVGIIVAYKMWYLPTKDAEAQSEMFYAEGYFEKDSFNVAINGGRIIKLADGTDKTVMGFEEIADQYGLTPSGNLAQYYLGISYLRTGKFEDAIAHLEKFSTNDVILNSVAVGAMGDAHMELNKADEAIKYYLKAADQNSNTFTSPIYLKKAATAYETKGNYAEAVKLYERIQKEYNKSTEARDMDKFITRAKILGNL
ncbi:MAG TPA: tetratricopeptide repeat protein [Bacteroidia bacterium]|jgi:tetratricopeptide (TPR) repeat protein|nr:tetratricopeptide repeat protein [Bacteroidia bacterium]